MKNPTFSYWNSEGVLAHLLHKIIMRRNVRTSLHARWSALAVLALILFAGLPSLQTVHAGSRGSSEISTNSPVASSNVTSSSTSTPSNFPVFVPQTTIVWPCGKGLPSGSAVTAQGVYAGKYIAKTFAVLPNGTKASIPTDAECHDATASASSTTLWEANAEADLAASTSSPASTLLGTNYCTSCTSITMSPSIVAGDVVVVAAQIPTGTLTVTDSRNTWATTAYSSGTDTVGVSYTTTQSTGGSDTIKVTGTVSGTISLEVYDVSGLTYTGYSALTVTSSCTSSCSSSIATGSRSFVQPSFLIASVFASPGSSTSTAGSGFTLNMAHYNNLQASEVGVSTLTSGPADPSTFPLTDGTTPTSWNELGVAIQEPTYSSMSASWTVPPAPSNTNGMSSSLKSVMLWDGFVDSSAGSYGGYVLQPLIAYGCVRVNAFGQCVVPTSGTLGWNMFAWVNGFSSSSGLWTGPQAISAGDSITGTVTYLSSYSGCGGPAYEVYIKDNSIGGSSSNPEIYYQCTSDHFGTAEGQVLEATTNISSCNQMPHTTSETASSISISAVNSAHISYVGGYTGSPNCGVSPGYSWSGGSSATIYWADT